MTFGQWVGNIKYKRIEGARILRQIFGEPRFGGGRDYFRNLEKFMGNFKRNITFLRMCLHLLWKVARVRGEWITLLTEVSVAKCAALAVKMHSH